MPHKKFHYCNHYYKKTLTVTFKKAFGGGHDFKLPRLMPMINRDGYVFINRGGYKKPTHKIN